MKIILIGGHRKSGTSTFLSLFDGTPNLYVPKFDLNFLWAYYPKWASPELSQHEREERLIQVTARDWIAYEYQIPGERDYSIPLDHWEAELKTRFKNCDLVDIGSVTGLLLEFLWDAAPRSTQTLVLKDTSIEIYLPLIAETLSSMSTSFVQLFRDPRDNWAAIAAGMERYSHLGSTRMESLLSLLVRYSLGFRSSQMLAAGIPLTPGYVIRFEDLVRETEKTMLSLADQVGIEFSRTMLSPTYGGMNYEGNSHERRTFRGLSAVNVGRWAGRIPQDEAAFVEACLEEAMIGLGYNLAYSRTERAAAMATLYPRVNQAMFFRDPF